VVGAIVRKLFQAFHSVQAFGDAIAAKSWVLFNTFFQMARQCFAMSKSRIVESLRRKRVEILLMVREREIQVGALRREIAQIDATLMRFNSSARPSSLASKRRPFARMELPSRIVDMLGHSKRGWVSVEAIAAQLMADKGFDDLSGLAIRNMTHTALKVMHKRGIVEHDEMSKRWALKF